MNPFSTRQAAETYLSRSADPAVREATRTRLGLDLSHPPIGRIPSDPAPLPRSVALHATGQGLTLTLPFPPLLNAIWRATVVWCKPRKTGSIPYTARVLLSERGRQYRRAVQDCVAALDHPQTPPGARLARLLIVCPPDQRARDLSNIPKGLEDALTHARVWADDSLIDELTVRRAPVHPGGRVIVQITPLRNTLFGGEA